jgi:hypothetical protein
VLAAQADLSKEWLRITGDSFVVGVRSVYDKAQDVRDLGSLAGLEKAVVEVCKYPFGAFEVKEPERLLQLWDTFEGRRMVGTWGVLYRFEVDEDDLIHVDDTPETPVCRVCGSELCDVDYLWSGVHYERHVKVYAQWTGR